MNTPTTETAEGPSAPPPTPEELSAARLFYLDQCWATHARIATLLSLSAEDFARLYEQEASRDES